MNRYVIIEKVGWGHSSIEQGVKFFDQTNIKSMMITHHAPYRTDNMLDEIASSLQDGVYFAKDEMSITI